MSVKNESKATEAKTEENSEEKGQGDLTEEQLEQVSGGTVSNVVKTDAEITKATINNFR